MKRFLLIFTLIISGCLVSCSSDDDDGPVAKDKIIGKWQISKEYFAGIEIPLTECDLQMTIEFFENETYIEKDFELDEDDACVAFPAVNGTWEYLGDSMYFLSDIGIESIEVQFSGNTMTAIISETIEGVTIEARIVFTKVS